MGQPPVRAVSATSAHEQLMSRRLLAVLALASVLDLAAAKTNEVGRKFLKENKKREGVKTLKSGLQYKVLKKGEGQLHPTKDATCSCHYAGTTPSLTPDAIDKPEEEWTVFDSSYKRGSPSEFSPGMVIKGWTEAMQKMVVGDKWEMYIPSELGYGDGGSGDKIKEGDVLIFRMEILKINGKTKRAVPCDLKTKENCEPDEITVIDTWGKKAIDEIDAEVKALTKQKESVLKAGLREQVVSTLKTLKQIAKARKKGEEL